MDIAQADRLLRPLGYSIVGVSLYDLTTETAHSSVQDKLGVISTMSASQIQTLLDSPICHLLNIPIIGNGHDDRELFQLAHGIVLDARARDADRITALQRIDDAVGGGQRCTWQDVIEYVDFHVEDSITEPC
jgi:hypothetical protein